MAITSYTQVRSGNLTVVTVVSDLSGTIFYHWYSDGAFLATTAEPTYTFLLTPGEQVRIDVTDTNDPDYDPIANAPPGYPARRSIWWIRSLSTDVTSYKVQQRRSGGDWETIAVVKHSDTKWALVAQTPPLDDRTDYAWRVVPVDAVGNDGPALDLGSEAVVRTPDAPRFTMNFDAPSNRVTFEEDA